MNFSTIAAIATPPGRGGIAIVRVSGPDIDAVAAAVMPGTRLEPRRAVLAGIVDERGRLIDRGLALLGRAPRTYTGEDTLELHVHGSPVVARDALRAVLSAGARLASPGEFTQRAFFNGKIDLNAAASVADLIEAETSSAARAAAANLSGGLARDVAAIRDVLALQLEELSGAIDFPDEVPEPERDALRAALDAIAGRLETLRRDGETGRLLREGVSVAIVGPPNAGKSSLLNALLGEERAIVSDIPGTTRDTIEESLVIDGVAVHLVDTAGIRDGAGVVEAAGIERTRRALERARIALIVIDGSMPLSRESDALLAETRDRNRVVFFNKADLGARGAESAGIADAVVGSVRSGGTLRELRRALAQCGWGGEAPDLERPHLATAREFDAVNAALDAVRRAITVVESGDPLDFSVGELQRAFAELGHVAGDVAAEEIVTGVFARFCIGK